MNLLFLCVFLMKEILVGFGGFDGFVFVARLNNRALVTQEECVFRVKLSV